MESLRPDDDELRGKQPDKAESPPTLREGEPVKSEKPAKAGAKSAKPAAKTKASPTKPAGRPLVLWGLVLASIAAGGTLGWQQQQRIAALEGQLEEADYWARQSKLALARFEGELSETGESLAETGASMEEQLASHGERLDTTDSEIRKLWVVANERNKATLAEHSTAIDSLKGTLASQHDQLTDLEQQANTASQRFTNQLKELKTQLASQQSALEQQLAAVAQQVSELEGETAQAIEQRLQRFRQERQLADAEVQSRLQALERQGQQQAGADDLSRAQARIAELEQTVKAIDASRAQLTSRLVRLSDEVSSLRAQVAQP
ncbi:MAG: hypothetical protein MI794_00130 [Pseudomonadales bacterium]|nr:hypothetical protein [Pseudomonadales bacterium]